MLSAEKRKKQLNQIKNKDKIFNNLLKSATKSYMEANFPAKKDNQEELKIDDPPIIPIDKKFEEDLSKSQAKIIKIQKKRGRKKKNSN